MNDRHRFRELCHNARSAATSGDHSTTIAALREADEVLTELCRKLRANYEPISIDCYRNHLQATAYDCLRAFGEEVDALEVMKNLLTGWSSWGVRCQTSGCGSASLNWRWKVAAIPETYLPKVWPQPYIS